MGFFIPFLTNLTTIIDESERGHILRLIFWRNQPGDVLLETQGKPHDTSKRG
jgi:hypothetical protein